MQFEFENPAFQGDVTLQFEQDVREVAAAPDSDFRDIRTLSRPQYSTTESGRVRVSRLGRRGTILTRSGTQIGENVHFYYDLSTIGSDTADAIELSTLGQQSGDTTIVDGLAESSFVDVPNNTDVAYGEETLFDPQNEEFDNLHLVLTSTGRRGEVDNIPTLPPGTPLRIFIDDYGKDLIVNYPMSYDTSTVIVPDSAAHPLEPPILLDYLGSGYYLHPSLWKRRKRKRSDTYNSFTDGIVDATEW